MGEIRNFYYFTHGKSDDMQCIEIGTLFLEAEQNEQSRDDCWLDWLTDWLIGDQLPQLGERIEVNSTPSLARIGLNHNRWAMRMVGGNGMKDRPQCIGG